VLTTRRPHDVAATVAGAVDALRGLVKARVEYDEPFCMTGARTYPLDWVIAGGESGPHARPSHPDWFRSLRDQCATAGVPFLFKQWGEFSDFDHIGMAWNDLPDSIRGRQQFLDGKAMVRVGKTRAGRHLDGVEHNGFPVTS
jgi:hypothetical protein